MDCIYLIIEFGDIDWNLIVGIIGVIYNVNDLIIVDVEGLGMGKVCFVFMFVKSGRYLQLI